MQVFARKALLPGGWADNVLLTVAAGRLQTVAAGTAAAGADAEVGFVIPGLCNAHSHAFQRALVGHTEVRGPAGTDTFWTWRERMYALAARMDPGLLAAIARQAYVEMLESGFTAVAEFHYLHRDAGGADAAAMFTALRTAASETGIRLTYVPVLYERAGFDNAAASAAQRSFTFDLAAFLEHHAGACEAAGPSLHVAIGAHSLRAVGAESLQRVVEAAERCGQPMHLHIAEQQREVDECMAANQRRPVRWLLENFRVDAGWCLVHATHMDPEETAALAATGAVVCLCPSTEANLGDGLFPLQEFLRDGGRIAIGSDSHVSINPFEELRWLEYGQRIAAERRNVAALEDSHVGRELFQRVLAGGVQASNRAPAGLQEGAPADLVALFDDDPMLVGHEDDSLLDALVFSGYRLPIDRVMVAGEWQVSDGDHHGRNASRREFRAALERLGARG